MDSSATTAAPSLRTQGVLLERDRRVFARLPDLALGAGRIVALTGASGSGKTTALLALAGIRAPREGRIVVGGDDIWSLSAARRDRLSGRRIGLVFQSFHLIDAVSVEERGDHHLVPSLEGVAEAAGDVGERGPGP